MFVPLQKNQYYYRRKLNELFRKNSMTSGLERKIVYFYKTFDNQTVQEVISKWEKSNLFTCIMYNNKRSFY